MIDTGLPPVVDAVEGGHAAHLHRVRLLLFAATAAAALLLGVKAIGARGGGGAQLVGFVSAAETFTADSEGRRCAARRLAAHAMLGEDDLEAARQLIFDEGEEVVDNTAQAQMAHFIPLHEPNFLQVTQLLAKHADPAYAAGEEPWDLYFVFEKAAQAAAFEAFILAGPWRGLAGTFGTLVLAPWMQKHGNAGGAMVNTKSWAALAVLRPCYELIMYSDAEVQLLHPAGLVRGVRAKSHRMELFATFGSPWMQQTVASANLLRSFGEVAALEQMRKDSRNFTAFFHFSDIIVFNSRDVLDFLRLYRYPREALVLTEWVVAVHNAYGLFRAGRGEWTLVDLVRNGFPDALEGEKRIYSLEDAFNHLQDGDLRHLAERFPPGVMWAHASYCQRWPRECGSNSSIKYTFHNDRHART